MTEKIIGLATSSGDVSRCTLTEFACDLGRKKFQQDWAGELDELMRADALWEQTHTPDIEMVGSARAGAVEILKQNRRHLGCLPDVTSLEARRRPRPVPPDDEGEDDRDPGKLGTPWTLTKAGLAGLVPSMIDWATSQCELRSEMLVRFDNSNATLEDYYENLPDTTTVTLLVCSKSKILTENTTVDQRNILVSPLYTEAIAAGWRYLAIQRLTVGHGTKTALAKAMDEYLQDQHQDQKGWSTSGLDVIASKLVHQLQAGPSSLGTPAFVNTRPLSKPAKKT